MWLFPKHLIRKAGSALWSPEKSALRATIQAWRGLERPDQQAATGVPEGAETRVATAAHQARATWIILLVAVILFWLVWGNVYGLPFLAHLVVLSIAILCLAEIFKFAYIIWYCDHRGNVHAFLKEIWKNPLVLFNTYRRQKGSHSRG